MSRGKLDKESAARIEQQLPYVTDLKVAAFVLQPDMLSFAFPPDSKIPIAAVCFHDVACTLEEVRYALFESLAHLVWHRQKCEPPNEVLAIFFGRFYADDAALRLYTAREHLTEAVVSMLEAPKQKLWVLAKALKEKSPNDPIGQVISKLLESDQWHKTIQYRNKWVHDKPPILAGTGIAYERRNRLVIEDNSEGVTFGGGDEPQYSIDGLLDFLIPAMRLFVDTASALVRLYGDLINRKQDMLQLK